jgi:hypothetical protein
LIKKFLLIVLSTFLGTEINAQSIRINEASSSNSIYFDEDGDTPDWIEIYNHGSQAISINDWGLSDDVLELDKWTFPNISLAPDSYLLLWASSKDRRSISYARTLVNQGDNFKYIIPTYEPNNNWKNLDFDDLLWPQGVSGFGYGDGDDATLIPDGALSIFIRIPFEILNLDNLTSMILDVDYDDAFVAYINGTEVARENINGSPPSYDSESIQRHEALMYSGGSPERFLITDPLSILVEGENVLTIQGHNESSTSSDFTLIPFLTALFSRPTGIGVTPPNVLELDTRYPHTNFKISSESETITLSNSSGEIIDQLTVENLPPETSLGVNEDNLDLVIFSETTPGYQNSNNYYTGAVSESVIFSNNSGFLNESINLSLSGNSSGQVIRYTTDASIPTETDLVYSSPIQVVENTTVRARIFQTSNIPSITSSKSYIFDDIPEIDTVFLTTDPENLFDEETGIYVFGEAGTYSTWQPYFGANFWEDWERPVHISFYDSETNEIESEFDAGVKIFGGWSRGQNAQRSLALFARGRYGYSKFEESFFEELSYNDFQSLVLRNSGQDWVRSSIKDITLTSLMRGSGLDFQEHNAVSTYINGEYWGLYNMREKNNEHMLASKHNIDADEITILTMNAEVVCGSNSDYNNLISYVSSVDLTVDANFEYVKERVDLENYALYQAANIYYNNTDWPGNNIKYWNHPNGKWRWIMYDTDFGFGPHWNTANYWEDTLSFALDPNGPDWPNPAWSTLLFRKLSSNIGFRNQFINRYADELNTRFLPESVKTHIDILHQKIFSEIPFHYERWNADPYWGTNYYKDLMKEYADQRPFFAKEHIKSKFDLPDYHELTITNYDTNEGFVKVNNNLKIQESSWEGDYFETVPVQLKAIPETGYEFSHWGGESNSTDNIIYVNLTEDVEVIPYFSPNDSYDLIVINEINYNSSDDSNADDWIELFNPNPYQIDLSLWQIKDSDDSHEYVIPEGTFIEGEGFIVAVKDTSDYLSIFPDAINYIGNLGFGLGSSGDSVRLFDSDNILQDQVTYTSESPWPNCANDSGYTIELISPELDNSLAENWSCINLNGSPNAPNTEILSVPSNLKSVPVVFPNPTKSMLNITGQAQFYNVAIYNVSGQRLIDKQKVNQVDVSSFPSGVYFIKVNQGSDQFTLKFLKN